MKRIARPRLVQFWNIWEITPEVRKRGGKERRGAKYGSILIFQQNPHLSSFYDDTYPPHIFVYKYICPVISLDKNSYMYVFTHKF